MPHFGDRSRAGRFIVFAVAFALMVTIFACHELPSRDEAGLVRYPASVGKAPAVRVLRGTENFLKLTVRSRTDIFALVDGKLPKGARLLKYMGKGSSFAVTPTKGGFSFGGRKLHGTAIRLVPRVSGSLFVNGARYYGGVNLLVKRERSRAVIRVINVLNLEEYVLGVLAGETPYDTWRTASLKAQAIAARTYALDRWLKRTRADFDVYDDTRSMVYKTPPRSALKLQKVVNETRGQILTWHDRIFPAFFSSCCGGHTADAENVLTGHRITPLTARKCTYCHPRVSGAEKGCYAWDATVPIEDIRAALKQKIKGLWGITEIVPAKRESTGNKPERVTTVKIVYQHGKKSATMNAEKFRMLVGPDKIKSTKFTVSSRRYKILFSGRGYGHGVGFCQWGAEGMARRGIGYRQILLHYYPDTRIVKLY